MAWKFLDVSKPANKRYREETMQALNAWWAHFQNKRKNIEAFLEGRASWDLEDFMAETLQSIDEHLMWEFGGEGEGSYHLVITPETERQLRPLVETLIETAPKIVGWQFYSHRQPHSVEQTAELVQDTSKVNLLNLSFFAEYDQEHLIDLAFKHTEPIAEDKLADAVFTACEYLLGEEMLDRWIGDMTFASDPDVEFQSVTELPNTVAKLIEEMRATMPDKKIAEIRDSLEVIEFNVEPDEGDDSAERFDMQSAKTRIPQVWQAAHGGSPFDSSRFSKNGEKFCYLKMDSELDGTKVDAIEEAMNAALTKAGVGCTTGSAIGRNHGYIDLCLSNLEKAMPVIQEGCKAAGCPAETWLQFFDSELAGEWTAIGAGVATPPGMLHIT